MVNSDLYSGRKSPLFLPPKSTEIGPVFVRVSGLGFYRVFLPVLRMPPHRGVGDSQLAPYGSMAEALGVEPGDLALQPFSVQL